MASQKGTTKEAYCGFGKEFEEAEHFTSVGSPEGSITYTKVVPE